MLKSVLISWSLQFIDGLTRRVKVIALTLMALLSSYLMVSIVILTSKCIGARVTLACRRSFATRLLCGFGFRPAARQRLSLRLKVMTLFSRNVIC